MFINASVSCFYNDLKASTPTELTRHDNFYGNFSLCAVEYLIWSIGQEVISRLKVFTD